MVYVGAEWWSSIRRETSSSHATASRVSHPPPDLSSWVGGRHRTSRCFIEVDNLCCFSFHRLKHNDTPEVWVSTCCDKIQSVHHQLQTEGLTWRKSLVHDLLISAETAPPFFLLFSPKETDYTFLSIWSPQTVMCDLFNCSVVNHLPQKRREKK